MTDRLILSVATLARLAAAAEDRPLLLVVEDAHRVDPVSGRALNLAVWRLLADHVAVVLAWHPTAADRIVGPWPRPSLPGLNADDVADLITAESGVQPSAAVISRILDETHGKALAVSTLARRPFDPVLAGAAPMLITLPLRDVAQRTFADLMRCSPHADRR
ncbi:hypothetical protein [Actinoplanes sp. NPDC023714]|uniref:hypothetical protein n=1 Tax=Actinoplanes sp. NPDC023714 TaxID=3154322 RepID=UPI0033DEF0C4